MSKGGFTTSADAQAWIDGVRAKHAKGIRVVDRPTVESYMAGWMKHKRAHLKKGSVTQYEGLIARIIVPHLGHIKLDELRAHHIRAAFDSYLADPTRAKTRAGGITTIQRTKAVLSSALADAERESLVDKNFARLVKLPSAPSSKAQVWTKAHEARWRAGVQEFRDAGHTLIESRALVPKPSVVMCWSPRHVGAFLDHVEDDRNYALWWILLTRGLRRGEATGLQHQDIDEEYGTLTIARQRIAEDHGVVRIETPKSESGRRTIALGKEGLEVLNAHRKAHRDVIGPWLFTDDHGRPLNPRIVARDFKRLTRGADLPPIRLHDTRHTAATLALASGTDLATARDQLGHSSIKITSRYLSMLDEVAQTSADNVVAFIPRRATRSTP
ncbi:site-specific integrase [Rhodococcus sp. WB9]|uniref:tyrosine-type recombinase/integrase n=1 Tax=Rhodococcus sp. WB9 TaxID=2594007 RepID=UPI001642BE4A|nr:site-specific integrase [Rhodococcus sp. WB9]